MVQGKPISSKKYLDVKFRGRIPVGRPRLRWNDIKGILVVGEHKSMEETSRGQG
jgi:hypothetical protein